MTKPHDAKELKKHSLDAHQKLKDALAYRRIARDNFNSVLRNHPNLHVKATLLEKAGAQLVSETERVLEATRNAVSAYVDEAKHMNKVFERERGESFKG